MKVLNPVRAARCARHVVKRARTRSHNALPSVRCLASQSSQPPPRSGEPPHMSQSTADLLDRLEREARRSGKMPSGRTTGASAGVGADGTGNLGPFPMGVGLGAGAREKTWSKWSDLSVGGKFARTTRQTGNLTVIVFGAGLFCVLTYALTSELFAKNSPTVLHNEAIKLIKHSPAIKAHLLPPLSFTHTPSAGGTARHSSPVQSQIVRNSLTGHEHLILRFWIHGRGLNESEEVGVLGWCRGRWKDLKGWTCIAARRIGMIGPDESQAKTTVAHEDQSSVHPSAKEHASSSSRSSGSWWGMFSSLRPSAAKGHEHAAVKMGRKELPPAGTYKQGEARADYVKDPETQVYRLLTLTVDVPSYRASYKQRAVIFWGDDSEVRREGLLEGGGNRVAW